MKFVRLVRSHSQGGKIVCVMEQDVPFEGETVSGHIIGEDCSTEDHGAVLEEREWSTLDGKRCPMSRHIFERIEHPDPEVRAALPAAIDVPCTMEGVRKRLREKGPSGIHPHVRAWLANILPDHHVAAMGLGRGLTISARKAAEALRNRRDPHSGSRMSVLERQAQEQADAHAAARHRKRLKEAAKK